MEGQTLNHIIIGSDWIRSHMDTFLKIVGFGNSINRLVTNEDVEEETLVKYKDNFGESVKKETSYKLVKHHIDTGDRKPVAKRGYQVPYHWQEEIQKEIDKELELGILRYSKSEWASGIVPVRKKDGSLRLCIDYRPLNEITIKDKYPLPRIDEVIDRLSKAVVFTTLDAVSGYHQFEIAEEDKCKTAFKFRGGFYEYNRMPFGLCNAPATFQRAMDRLFSGSHSEYVIPYLDDIIVFSENIDDHKRHIEIVMEKLKESGLILNKNKCKFYKEEIEILGRVVSHKLVKPTKDKIRAINTFKRPENLRELRSFLGLISFCREFIVDASTKTAPLNALLVGESKRSIKRIEWSETLKEHFYNLRNELSEYTLRHQPNMDGEFIVTTDASEYAVGATLGQTDDSGNFRLVHTFSKSMDKCQRNYSTTEKELLAIVLSLGKFRKYLLGKQFRLRTDHKALEALKTTENLLGKLVRWSLKLQDYDFIIEYIKGEDNHADGLSRQICETEKRMVCSIKREIPIDERKSILESYHEGSGHGSAGTMMFLLNGKFKWEDIAKDAKAIVNSCKICLQEGNVIRNSMCRNITTGRPGELWECDLIVRSTKGSNSRVFILVVVDHFLKWIEAKVLRSKTENEIKVAINRICEDWNLMPTRIISDNGCEFKNKSIENWAREKDISWEYGSPYHHGSTGLVERYNQALWSKIRKISEFGSKSWVNCVEKAVFGCNISFNRAIGTSPYIARFGRQPGLEIDKAYNLDEMKPRCIEKIHDEIRVANKKYVASQSKKGPELKRDIQLGSRVLVYNHTPSSPLDRRWKPGFRVVGLEGLDSYVLEHGKRKYRYNKIHVKIDGTV